MNIVISGIGAAVFSCYIVFDVQLMMGGGTYSIEPDEYVFAGELTSKQQAEYRSMARVSSVLWGPSAVLPCVVRPYTKDLDWLPAASVAKAFLQCSTQMCLCPATYSQAPSSGTSGFASSFVLLTGPALFLSHSALLLPCGVVCLARQLSTSTW